MTVATADRTLDVARNDSPCGLKSIYFAADLVGLGCSEWWSACIDVGERRDAPFFCASRLTSAAVSIKNV